MLFRSPKHRASGKLKAPSESFSSVFGRELVLRARRDHKICAITAAMEEGTGLSAFAAEFGPKNRFFDVGIAEEHAVTFACGLAAGGMKPVFAVYSTFLQRGFDQIIHDASIERQHIVLAVDRAGIVGEDGETHQGLFDAAFLSEIPGVTVYSPATYGDLRYALDQAFDCCDGVAAVRYPRGGEIPVDERLGYRPGEWFHHRSGGQTLIVSYGRAFGEAYGAMELLAAEGKKADLLKLHRISPIPDACVQLAKKYRAIYFVEEGVRQGGIGEHFLDALSRVRYRGRMTIGAVENPFIPAMPADSALRRCGLDAHTVARAISELYF